MIVCDSRPVAWAGPLDLEVAHHGVELASLINAAPAPALPRFGDASLAIRIDRHRTRAGTRACRCSRARL